MSKRPSTTDRDRSVTESGDGDPFLSRWARRKRIQRAGGDPDAESSVEREELADATPVSADSPPAGEDSQPPELTDEDMPPLDSIDENTDMSGFFSAKVSQAVKKAALRKFFHSPAFNVVDGLDDYDDDFRNFAALGDIVTSDMRSQMDREAERAREAAAEDARESVAAGDQEDETPAPPDARADESGETDGADEQPEIADDNSSPEQMVAAESGVVREPGKRARVAHGKLRPKGAAADRDS